MTDRKPVTYHGQADVARWCGVGRAAVTNWLTRYPDEAPAPDVLITNESSNKPIRGWLPERRTEWLAFAAARGPAFASPSAASRRTQRTADRIIAEVKSGQLDAALAADLLHELIGSAKTTGEEARDGEHGP